MITKGQSDNTDWFHFRKGTITASKSHEIKTKMEKFVNGGSGYVNMWSLCQKISGFYPALTQIYLPLSMEGIWSYMLLMYFLKFLSAATKSQGYVIVGYFLMVNNHSFVLVLMEL